MGRRPGRKSGTKEKTIKYFDYTLLFVIIFVWLCCTAPVLIMHRLSMAMELII